MRLRSPLQKDFLAWQVNVYYYCLLSCCVYTLAYITLYFLLQTWDLLQIMYKGFIGLCEHVLNNHPGYFISPLRINGSAVETIFSSLKFISGGNLSSTNYPTSLAAFATQRDIAKNPYSEPGYRS